MTNESPKKLVPKFFDNTANTYDKIAVWCTFSKDRYWKNEIVRHTEGKLILDLACGTGILTRKIAEKFPNSKVIGVDITESYLQLAKKNSISFNNIDYILQDAENLNLDSKFDCITSSYIPKYCDAKILVKKCVEHLNPGGKIIFHDFTYPKNFLHRKLWNFYFVILNFIGFFIPSWKEAFEKLPKLIRSSTWMDSYSNAMKKNGLVVEQHSLTYDSSAILIGTSKISE
ncbi:MAG TPA: class I SAM-dependent methyltransferase [Nitrosopumilaceae archaeon]|nr:class I SAM-dependent methyltransferase [Nitrosopumilaceae archaeon]